MWAERTRQTSLWDSDSLQHEAHIRREEKRREEKRREEKRREEKRREEKRREEKRREEKRREEKRREEKRREEVTLLLWEWRRDEVGTCPSPISSSVPLSVVSASPALASCVPRGSSFVLPQYVADPQPEKKQTHEQKWLFQSSKTNRYTLNLLMH